MSKKEDKKNKKRLFMTAGLIALIMTAMFVMTLNPILKTTLPTDYDKLVAKYAKEYSVDAALIYAVIKTESGFNPAAKSSADARGLMQITPDTFEWLQTKTQDSYELEALFEPDVNIKYGVFFLSMLIREFNNTETALAAYNAGMNRIKGWLQDPDLSDDGKSLKYIPISETRYYVKKVVSALELYKKVYKL